MCGYGYYYPEGWSQGVTEHFRLTHWPYVNEKFIERCMQNMSMNSPMNLVLSATTLSTTFAALMLAVTLH